MDSPIFPWDKTEVQLSANTKQKVRHCLRKALDPIKGGSLGHQLQVTEMRSLSRDA